VKKKSDSQDNCLPFVLNYQDPQSPVDDVMEKRELCKRQWEENTVLLVSSRHLDSFLFPE
jgi:hypothetical protein